MKYFNNFPIITYSNTEVIDITRRVKIVEKGKRTPFAFYPYDITTHIRSDTIAEYYYETPYLDWLIYLSNEIIDPYYDWYIKDDQLDSLIRSKYISIENAKKRIKYFMNNWYENSDESITISFYENTLARPLKKYWTPHFSENGKIISYNRKRIDDIMNTNKIIDYKIEYLEGEEFDNLELVDIYQNANQVGTAEVVFSNSTIVRLKSIQGNTFANSTSNTYIIGETSYSNAHANFYTIQLTNIPDDEYSYWSPVYIYDYEIVKNEENRTIKLVDNSIVPFLTSEFLSKIKSNT